MFRKTRITILLIFIGLVLTSLAAYQIIKASRGSIKVSPRLSEEEVLKMADEFVAKKMVGHKNLDIDYYPDRSPKFTDTTKMWYVLYMGKSNQPGDHLQVFIDDTTGEIRLMLGK